MLEKCTFANTSSIDEMIVKGQFDAKVLKVYDGDTVWVAYKNERLGYIKTKVRLNRIDAPEIRGHAGESSFDKDIRKEKAETSRNVVSELVGGKIVKLIITGLDKYSRILGDILIDEKQWSETNIGSSFKLHEQYEEKVSGTNYVNLSNFMLYGGYAEKY